jgi:hypothetical protein
MFEQEIVSSELVALRDNFTIDLKSLLGSSQAGLTERELHREYSSLTGE